MSMLDPSKQQEALAYLGQNQGAPEDDEEMAPPPQGSAPPPDMGADMGAEAPPDAGPQNSSMLSDEDLAAMQSDPAASQQQDPQVAAVIAALENPDTPPEMKQRIETMLALSARRRLAGLNS